TYCSRHVPVAPRTSASCRIPATRTGGWSATCDAPFRGSAHACVGGGKAGRVAGHSRRWHVASPSLTIWIGTDRSHRSEQECWAHGDASGGVVRGHGQRWAEAAEVLW